MEIVQFIDWRTIIDLWDIKKNNQHKETRKW